MRKIAFWPKILNARNPFTRLYSAWNDKATSFPMHYNGSITYNGIDLMSRFRNKTELVMFIQKNTHKYNDRYHRQGSSQVPSAQQKRHLVVDLSSENPCEEVGNHLKKQNRLISSYLGRLL